MAEKTGDNYVFGNFLGNFLSNIDQQTQYEASLMSMACILLGLIAMLIYVPFSDFNLFFKILMMVNSAAGFIFISSYLATALQQYKAYMVFKKLDNSMDEILPLKDIKIVDNQLITTKEAENG